MQPPIMSLSKYSIRHRMFLCVFQVRSPQMTEKSEKSPVSKKLQQKLENVVSISGE